MFQRIRGSAASVYATCVMLLACALVATVVGYELAARATSSVGLRRALIEVGTPFQLGRCALSVRCTESLVSGVTSTVEQRYLVTHV